MTTKKTSKQKENSVIPSTSTVPEIYSGAEKKTEYNEEGFKVFKDKIEINVLNDELHFMWNTCKDLMEGGGNLMGKSPVPPHEANMMIELMERMAKQEKDTRKEYKISLPINFINGLWHSLNSARKFAIYKEDTDKHTYLTDVTLKVATLLDQYHSRQENDGFMKSMKPSISSSPKSVFELADKSTE